MTKGPREATVRLKSGVYYMCATVTAFFDLGVIHINHHGNERTVSFDKIESIDWSPERASE